MGFLRRLQITNLAYLAGTDRLSSLPLAPKRNQWDQNSAEPKFKTSEHEHDVPRSSRYLMEASTSTSYSASTLSAIENVPSQSNVSASSASSHASAIRKLHPSEPARRSMKFRHCGWQRSIRGLRLSGWLDNSWLLMFQRFSHCSLTCSGINPQSRMDLRNGLIIPEFSHVGGPYSPDFSVRAPTFVVGLRAPASIALLSVVVSTGLQACRTRTFARSSENV
jgi:hypothetical protein